MLRKTIAKIALKLALLLVLGGTFCSFYLMEQAKDYFKKREAFSTRGEKVDLLSIPGILFCLNPGYKPSIAEKYGYTLDDPSFLWKDEAEKYLKFNLTIWQAYNELTYQANKDYELTFEYTSTFGEEMFTTELKPTSQKDISIYQHGMCSLISFSTIVKPNIAWKMNVKFAPHKDMPKGFKVFVTSQNTLHGLLISEWPYEKLFLNEFETSFDVSKYAFLNLKASEVQYLMASSYSTPDECIEDYLNASQCAFKCFPIVFNYMNFPPCTTKEEVGCMFSELYGPRKMQLYDCMKPPKATIYRISDMIFDEPVPQNDTMQVKFIFQSNIKDYHEQVYVISLTSFVGNIGGSLGLFFGFSFLAVFFHCIDKMFMRIDN